MSDDFIAGLIVGALVGGWAGFVFAVWGYTKYFWLIRKSP